MYILFTSLFSMNVPLSSEETLFMDSVIANKIISRSFTENFVNICVGLCRKIERHFQNQLNATILHKNVFILSYHTPFYVYSRRKNTFSRVNEVRRFVWINYISCCQIFPFILDRCSLKFGLAN